MRWYLLRRLKNRLMFRWESKGTLVHIGSLIKDLLPYIHLHYSSMLLGVSSLGPKTKNGQEEEKKEVHLRPWVHGGRTWYSYLWCGIPTVYSLDRPGKQRSLKHPVLTERSKLDVWRLENWLSLYLKIKQIRCQLHSTDYECQSILGLVVSQ